MNIAVKFVMDETINRIKSEINNSKVDPETCSIGVHISNTQYINGLERAIEICQSIIEES